MSKKTWEELESKAKELNYSAEDVAKLPRVSGIPVLRAMRVLTPEIPTALFHEKLNPGILNLDILFI